MNYLVAKLHCIWQKMLSLCTYVIACALSIRVLL